MKMEEAVTKQHIYMLSSYFLPSFFYTFQVIQVWYIINWKCNKYNWHLNWRNQWDLRVISGMFCKVINCYMNSVKA